MLIGKKRGSEERITNWIQSVAPQYVTCKLKCQIKERGALSSSQGEYLPYDIPLGYWHISALCGSFHVFHAKGVGCLKSLPFPYLEHRATACSFLFYIYIPTTLRCFPGLPKGTAQICNKLSRVVHLFHWLWTGREHMPDPFPLSSWAICWLFWIDAENQRIIFLRPPVTRRSPGNWKSSCLGSSV